MPELIALYEDHAAERDKFAVITIHDKSVKSLAELDPKLATIKKDDWQGKDLPFPVLLDATGKTEELFGITAHPTGLLIDPDGKLVGHASAETLEQKLTPLPASKKWARNRDVQKNVSWSFEPTEYTPKKLAEMLARWTQCEIEVDADAIKAAGLDCDQPLPAALFGSPITLRSIDELLLAAHGLGIAASSDDKKLLISKRAQSSDGESYAQMLRCKALNERINRARNESDKDAKPLEIKDQPLLEAAKMIANEFDVPIALDAKAVREKTVDLAAKVSGTIGPGDLRSSITAMLAPLGLTIEVRDEVVLVTPGQK